MKILALEKEIPGTSAERFQPSLKAEAARIWELYLSGVLREIYFRADQHSAVLVLECASANEAQEILSTLPFVRNGLITFEVIALKAYPGFERLFT